MDQEPTLSEGTWIPGPPAGQVVPVHRAGKPRGGTRGVLGRVASLVLAFALGSLATVAWLGTDGDRPAALRDTGAAAVAPAATAAIATDADGTSGAAAAAVKRATERAAAARLAADRAFADMVATVQPTVVTVTAAVADPFVSSVGENTGSGVVITRDGYVLTNAHVVDGADAVVVTFGDGRELRAQVVAERAERDLALLKVAATKLRAAKVGDSSAVRVGQTAVAVGNPLGRYPGTVTRGIISGLDRAIDVSDHGWQVLRLSGLIQTDAAINEGSSGGALFDLEGRLIGITNAVNERAQGVAFAIPIAAAAALIERAQQNAG